MAKQGKEHAVGPYTHGRKFRIVYFGANGASETVAYTTEAEAIAERDAYNAAAGSRTVGEAVALYLEEHAEQKGLDTTRYRLMAMLRLKEGDRPLSALTAPLARKLYEQRTTECAVDTHRGELAYVTRFCAWCVTRGWIRLNPFAEVKPIGKKRRGKPKLRVNGTRQYVAVLLEDESLEATAVLTALSLGLRANEVVGRTVDDLDDDGHILWIRDSKTEHSDREMEIPSGAPLFLRERLLKLAAGKQRTDKIFGDLTRHGLHYHTVRYCKLAGVDRVTPHGLRGSGATEALRGSMLGGGAMVQPKSLKEVAAGLGHADDGETAKRHYIGGGAMESARARAIQNLVKRGSDTGSAPADNCYPEDNRAPLAHRASEPHSKGIEETYEADDIN